MEAKLKHLEMIQGIINRMGQNSFQLKGYGVLLTSALLTISAGSSHPGFVWLAFFPCLMFWLLDAYYLRQERLFRKLYQAIAVSETFDSTFSMNTQSYDTQVASWLGVCCSRTLLIFYGAAFIMICAAMLLI